MEGRVGFMVSGEGESSARLKSANELSCYTYWHLDVLHSVWNAGDTSVQETETPGLPLDGLCELGPREWWSAQQPIVKKQLAHWKRSFALEVPLGTLQELNFWCPCRILSLHHL